MKALVLLVALMGVAEAGKHCHETSPIVGRQHCGSFGEPWSSQIWMGLFGFEAGLALDRIPVPAIDQSGTVYNAQGTATYRATTPGRRAMWTMGPRERFGFRGEHYILAFEFVAGFALSAPIVTSTVDGEGSTSSHGSVFDASIVNGYHARFGPFELGAELGLGIRNLALAMTLPDGYTSCMGGGTGKGCGIAVTDASLLVEPRGRIEAWLDPQVTMGLSAGYDVVNHGETFVLTLAYHSSVFDGQ